MKTLSRITPTPEQLPLISANRLGVEVIRGAAGSGKTSTAILRLRSLAYMFEERRLREGTDAPVRMLVLTFNRTLSGYVHELVQDQLRQLPNTEVTVDTFGRWAMSYLDYPSVVNDSARDAHVQWLARNLPLSRRYIVKEVDYLLGRFPTNALENYVTAERTGRGTEPRVERAIRRRLLDEVVYPYLKWLEERNQLDWNGVAVQMAAAQPAEYDVVIVDESQDFSANQLRALRRHLAAEFSATFVVDTVQRIYARGFTWAETGFDMQRASYHTLRTNHRNTIEIAAFARGVLDGIEVEADGSLPDLARARSHGPKPKVLTGLYSSQVDWVITNILNTIDLSKETVAFLKPQGGGYFVYLRERLISSGVSICRNHP